MMNAEYVDNRPRMVEYEKLVEMAEKISHESEVAKLSAERFVWQVGINCFMMWLITTAFVVYQTNYFNSNEPLILSLYFALTLMIVVSFSFAGYWQYRKLRARMVENSRLLADLMIKTDEFKPILKQELGVLEQKIYDMRLSRIKFDA